MYRTVPKLGEVWRSNDGPKALKTLLITNTTEFKY